MQEKYDVSIASNEHTKTVLEDSQRRFVETKSQLADVEEKYKKILLIGTGSLHSPTLVNQKSTIPSIAHAISLEVTDDIH